MENNPFAKPHLLDRKIEIFTACSKCNSPFQNRDGTVNIEVEKVPDGTKAKCLTCKTQYTFINWNDDHPIGLHRERD